MSQLDSKINMVVYFSLEIKQAHVAKCLNGVEQKVSCSTLYWLRDGFRQGLDSE